MYDENYKLIDMFYCYHKIKNQPNITFNLNLFNESFTLQRIICCSV